MDGPRAENESLGWFFAFAAAFFVAGPGILAGWAFENWVIDPVVGETTILHWLMSGEGPDPSLFKQVLLLLPGSFIASTIFWFIGVWLKLLPPGD